MPTRSEFSRSVSGATNTSIGRGSDHKLPVVLVRTCQSCNAAWILERAGKGFIVPAVFGVSHSNFQRRHVSVTGLRIPLGPGVATVSAYREFSYLRSRRPGSSREKPCNLVRFNQAFRKQMCRAISTYFISQGTPVREVPSR